MVSDFKEVLDIAIVYLGVCHGQKRIARLVRPWWLI